MPPSVPPSAPPAAPKQTTQTTLFTVLALTVTFSWGTLFYHVAVLMKPMQVALGVSAQALAGAFSLCLAVSGIAAVFAGRWLDAHGGRGLMSGAALLAGIGMALLASAQSLPQVYLAYVCIGAAMAGTLYDPAFTVITQLCGADKAAARRAITWTTVAGGLASTIFWPLTQWLETQFGWRVALYLIAVVFVFIVAPLHAWVLPSKALLVEPLKTVNTPSSSEVLLQEALWRTFFGPVFILLAIWFAAHAMVLSGTSVQILNVLQAQGLTAQLAATLAGCIGIAQVAGRLGELVSGGKLPVLKLALVVTLLMPSGMACLYVANGSVPWIIGFVLCYGIANGVLTIVRGTIITYLFGNARYGTLLGALGFIGQTFKATAPLAATWVWSAGAPDAGSPNALVMWGVGLGGVALLCLLGIMACTSNEPPPATAAAPNPTL